MEKQWYKSTLLEVNGDKFKIHYDGWADTWDEEVDGNRIRAVEEK